jgi:hypothetical protein
MLLLGNTVIISFMKPLRNASTGLTKTGEFNPNLFSDLHGIPRMNMHPIQAGQSKIFSCGSRENRMPFLP